MTGMSGNNLLDGTEGETRTRKPVKAGDFESPVSTNSTTPASLRRTITDQITKRNDALS